MENNKPKPNPPSIKGIDSPPEIITAPTIFPSLTCNPQDPQFRFMLFQLQQLKFNQPPPEPKKNKIKKGEIIKKSKNRKKSQMSIRFEMQTLFLQVQKYIKFTLQNLK